MALTVRELVTVWGFDIHDKPLKKVENSFKILQRSALVVGASVGVAAAKIGLLVNEAGKLEQTEIAFATLLGSSEEAKLRLEELFEFAKTTPFTIPGILEESKRLLAFGFAGNELTDVMNKLGNIAAGVGTDKLPFLVKAFADVRSAGRLMGREVLQFVNAGVALVPELAKQFGRTQLEIRQMIEQGEISFQDVDELLTRLTTGSGRFADLMSKQSKTFFGLLSNIKDAIVVLSTEIGKELLPTAKEIAGEFLTFLETNKALIKLQAAKFMRILASFIQDVFKVLKTSLAVLKPFIALLGGAENAVKLLTLALSAFLGLSIANFLGTAVLTLGSFTLALLSAKGAALALNAAVALIPLAIGALIIAVGLVIEDIIAFFKGKESVTGLMVASFKNAFTYIESQFNRLPTFFRGLLAAVVGVIKTPLTIINNMIDSFKEMLSFLKGDSSLGSLLKTVGKSVLTVHPIINASVGAGRGVSEGFQGALGLERGPESADQIRSSSIGNINLNSPVTVTIPEGTSPNEVGPSVTEGIRQAMSDVFRTTLRANEPQVMF